MRNAYDMVSDCDLAYQVVSSEPREALRTQSGLSLSPSQVLPGVPTDSPCPAFPVVWPSVWKTTSSCSNSSGCPPPLKRRSRTIAIDVQLPFSFGDDEESVSSGWPGEDEVSRTRAGENNQHAIATANESRSVGEGSVAVHVEIKEPIRNTHFKPEEVERPQIYVDVDRDAYVHEQSQHTSPVESIAHQPAAISLNDAPQTPASPRISSIPPPAPSLPFSYAEPLKPVSPSCSPITSQTHYRGCYNSTCSTWSTYSDFGSSVLAPIRDRGHAQGAGSLGSARGEMFAAAAAIRYCTHAPQPHA
ncbi:hypothetical protein HK102_010486 [Quaeritorhiza haematococci]|nr:hypothetical protein HK102_010486 [Quaeritorhiza haematococci]